LRDYLKKMKKINFDELRIIPLGGLGEIGLNMMVVEYGADMIVIDAGLMFPEDYMLGVDIVIPDISYLRRNSDRLRAIILTHGHEDHIGALPFILKELNLPIYGTALTLELVRDKLKEHHLEDKVQLRRISARERLKIGSIEIEFIQVSHSILDGVGLAISTPIGNIIHTGDFKMDLSSIDIDGTDFNKFAEYSEKSVLALLSDSTNAEKEGYTLSEHEIGKTLEDIFSQSEGRVIVAMFASNIYRMQQVVNIAHNFGRKILLIGRSMVANARIAKKLGYLKIPKGMLIDVKDITKYDSKEIAMITTGSQGEPLSALTLMATNSHKQIKIEKGDTVILSSRFIPGNERAITNIINHLYRRGADVIYEKISDIHTSGHAYQEELKLMIKIVRPLYFIPIHGEYRHLYRHIKIAQSVGIPKGNTILAEDGDVIIFDQYGARIEGKVEVGKIFVDGKGVGDVGEMVLRDRKHLSEDGIVISFMVLNEKTGDIEYGPDIITKGFVFEERYPELIEGAKKVAIETFIQANPETKTDTLEINEEIRRALRRYFNKIVKRKPVTIPIIVTM